MSLIDEVRASRRLPTPAVARMIREEAGVTQEALAAELGVHRVTLARWEAGTCAPRAAFRAQYARLLDELRRELAS